MNIFILDLNPVQAAKFYPDKLCNKISLEICQMLATNFSEDFLNWGEIHKKNGKPYKKSFPNHPCTVWMRKNNENLAWSIVHGLALAHQHYKRFGKMPATYHTLIQAKNIFKEKTQQPLAIYKNVSKFARAMPENLKYNRNINDIEAYREYLHTKTYPKWEKLNNIPFWWGQTKLKTVKYTVPTW